MPLGRLGDGRQQVRARDLVDQLGGMRAQQRPAVIAGDGQVDEEPEGRLGAGVEPDVLIDPLPRVQVEGPAPLAKLLGRVDDQLELARRAGQGAVGEPLGDLQAVLRRRDGDQVEVAAPLLVCPEGSRSDQPDGLGEGREAGRCGIQITLVNDGVILVRRSEMMFSTKAEYGVRVMAHLARHATERPTPLSAIAEAEGLPLAYLEHLVQRLRRADLVVSTRGAHGGYTLAREAGDITMAEVVEALEGQIAPIECLTATEDGRVVCSRESDSDHVCPTKLLWTRVQGSIVRTLSEMTLEDLVTPRRRRVAA